MFGGDLPHSKHLHQAPAWKLPALVNFDVSLPRSRFKTDRGEITISFFLIEFPITFCQILHQLELAH